MISEQLKQTILFSFLFLKNLYFFIDIGTNTIYNDEYYTHKNVFLFLTGYFFIEIGYLCCLCGSIINRNRYVWNCIVTNLIFIMTGFYFSCSLISMKILFLNVFIFLWYEYMGYMISVKLLHRSLYKVSKDDFKYESCGCSICLEDFDKEDCGKLSRFKCYHIYHKSCIENYQKVSKNTSCPLCRV